MTFTQGYYEAQAAGMLPAYLQLVGEGFPPAQALIIIEGVKNGCSS
jgi:hypothetical protein